MDPSPELREFTLRFYQALATGDLDFVARHTARAEGVLGIGTDAREWWIGYETLIHTWRTQSQEMGGALPITPGDPQAYQEGSVGWVADRSDIAFPDIPPIPFRLTLVFHREDGAWKMVQFHILVGVANEQALGKELTV